MRASHTSIFTLQAKISETRDRGERDVAEYIQDGGSSAQLPQNGRTRIKQIYKLDELHPRMWQLNW